MTTRRRFADPEHQAEREQSQAESRAQVAVKLRRLREQWQRSGFDPRWHLRQVSAAGDAEAMHAFYRVERVAWAGRSVVASMLATLDMYDLARAIAGRPGKGA